MLIQLEEINAKIRALDGAVTALQKENYSLKAKVFDLEKQIYLMNYKPKQQ
jgi:cell division protein FtsB